MILLAYPNRDVRSFRVKRLLAQEWLRITLSMSINDHTFYPTKPQESLPLNYNVPPEESSCSVHLLPSSHFWSHVERCSCRPFQYTGLVTIRQAEINEFHMITRMSNHHIYRF